MAVTQVDSDSLHGLGMRSADAEGIRKTLLRGRGVIFVCGPRGSGRHSAMYSILCSVNHESQSLILGDTSVQDCLDGVSQTQLQPGERLADWMQTAMRADVVMVKPLDTIADAISVVRAAGRRIVLVGSDAESSLGPLCEMMDMGASPEVICNSVTLVIATRIVPRLCPYCRREIKLPTEVLAPFAPLQQITHDTRAFESPGCDSCAKTGRRGWVGLYEVREVGPQLQSILGGDYSPKSLTDASMCTTAMSIMSHALEKSQAGLVDLRDLLPLVNSCPFDNDIRFWEN